MRQAVLLCVAGALLACTATRSQPLEVPLGEEATLSIGGTAVWSPDIKIRFAAVTEDSRCPIDTTCVWAGQLKIQLAIQTASKTATRELLESEHVAIDHYRVTFVRAKPHRMTDRKIGPKDYRVTLRVDG